MEGLVVEWMEHMGRGLERSQWAPGSVAEAAKKPQTHQAAADSGRLPQGNHRAAFGAVFNPDQIRLLGSSYWEASPKQVVTSSRHLGTSAGSASAWKCRGLLPLHRLIGGVVCGERGWHGSGSGSLEQTSHQ